MFALDFSSPVRNPINSGITSQADCERCPAGFKCEIEGTTEPAVCGAGFYSDFGAADCGACDIGHYCNLNTTTYIAMKFYNVCPEGTLCNYEGVDHIPDLKTDPCPIGFWCAKDGLFSLFLNYLRKYV
jgi:hypothetical protein